MTADGSIIIDTRINTDGFQNDITKIRSGFEGIGSTVKKVGAAIGAVFAVKQIVNFGKKVVDLGSDLQEVQNVVDSVFTTMSDKVDTFAQSAAQTAGLSETMAKRYTGTFGAMAKSFGFAESEALNMSTTLTQLTGDLASFYNISQDEAYTKLKSVFTGETEALKELGVVMTQSALDSYAMANGFGKTTAAMTEQEKVALRYQFVMKQLSTASGDFLRTSDSWANQVRVLQLQIESLKATIGQGLINILTPVIKVINTLLAKLATVANAFKAFTELITGNKSSGSTNAQQAGITDAVADEYNVAADGAQNLANATNDVADATKKATKEVNKYLSPLDQINRYSSSKIDTVGVLAPGGSASGATASGMLSVDYGNLAQGESVLEETESVLDRLIKKFNQLAEIFKEGFAEGLGSYRPVLEELRSDLNSIGESVCNIFSSTEVQAAAEGFAETFTRSLGQISGSFVSIGLTIAGNIVGGIESFLGQSTGRIQGYLTSMFDVGSQISAIYGQLATSFSDIFSVFVSQAAQEITGNVITIFTEIGMLISENTAKIGADILSMITVPFINNSGLIKDSIAGTLDTILPLTDGLVTAIQTVSDKVSEFYNTYLKPFLKSVGSGLSSIFATLLEGYNTYISILWHPVVMQGAFRKR